MGKQEGFSSLVFIIFFAILVIAIPFGTYIYTKSTAGPSLADRLKNITEESGSTFAGISLFFVDDTKHTPVLQQMTAVPTITPAVTLSVSPAPTPIVLTPTPTWEAPPIPRPTPTPTSTPTPTPTPTPQAPVPTFTFLHPSNAPVPTVIYTPN